MEKQSSQISESLLNFIMDGTPDEVVRRYAGLSQRASEADYGDLDTDIVVLDTETTGFSFHHDELTQIAAARMEKGEIVDWFVTFVNPGKPIPDEVAHLTDIHDEDVADAPLPEEALASLVKFVGTSKIVAHNVDFDRTFTTRHPSGYPLLENTWIDSLDLARIALPRLTSHRLIDIVKAFDAPLSTHRADADVAATCAAFRILLAAVEAMPEELISYIAAMNTEIPWQTRVVFEHFAANGKSSSSEAAVKVELDGVETQPVKVPLRAFRWARLNTYKTVSKNQDGAASEQKELSIPEKEDIEAAFSEEGLVGSLYSRYEQRKEQVQMAQAIRQAFEQSDNLVVEAGTGVGKSMAYLVPCALTALRNHITVGIATKTNALLDQLVFHELPALRDALLEAGESEPLAYTALKGFSHYPCLRKIDRLAVEGPARAKCKERRKRKPPL